MSNINIGSDAEMKGSAFGNENQVASEIEKVGGNFVQASEADVHIGNTFSGDRNVNVLGNLTIYLSSRSVEPDEKLENTGIGPNPYKGLSAFSEEDVARFFGRETLIVQLWERFRELHDTPQTRILSILGPSGSGKSSVARAGLLPELARNPFPGRSRARVAVLTPGSHPLRALAAILARIATNDPVPVAKTREFEEELRLSSPLSERERQFPSWEGQGVGKKRPKNYKTSEPTPHPSQEGNSSGSTTHYSPLEGGQGGVFDGLSRIADVLPDIAAAPLLIVVDQFEEVFSLCQDVEERRCMIQNLLTAAADPSGHVSVILTLRSDFLGHTQSYPDLNHVIAKQGVIVPVMNDAELREAIAKPAELAGHPLDDATIDLLIAQSAGREGALPLLQFALTRIWEGLAEGVAPADTLKNIGGVGGALAEEAQRLYEKLSDEDKAIARRAFLALVQLGEGTQDTRRRAAVPEIIAHGEDPAHVTGVLRLFAQPGARLITLSANSAASSLSERECQFPSWEGQGVGNKAQKNLKTPKPTPNPSQEGNLAASPRITHAKQMSMTAEVTHEALLSHWASLKEWLDSSRDDLRFHRRLAEAANYWEEQHQPDGLLWRPPDLDLLHEFHDRAGNDMTPVQMRFFTASVRREKHSKRLKRLAIAALLLFATVAGIAAYFAIQAQNDTLNRYAVLNIQSWTDQYFLKGEREQAALLARQSHILNSIYQAGFEDQIKDKLRTILVLPEGETEAMSEQVCQQATRNLTPDEWQQVVKDEDVVYQPCDGLPVVDRTEEIVLRLRSESMMTDECQHLTLYVNENGYVKTYIDNRFELQQEEKVVFDHATGLMWQHSASEEYLTYEDAKKYVEQLNAEKFAGYGNWRLPTVEQLASLMESEKKSNGFYIDPIFETREYEWVWSTDIYQIKGESGSSSAAWGVGFHLGLVDMYSVRYSLCVRAVRS